MQQGIKSIFLKETSAALAANAVLAGAVIDTNKWREFRPYEFFAFSISSHAAAANGFKIQGSEDGITFFDMAIASPGANAPVELKVLPCFRYYRVHYTNGAAIQTSFYLAIGARW